MPTNGHMAYACEGSIDQGHSCKDLHTRVLCFSRGRARSVGPWRHFSDNADLSIGKRIGKSAAPVDCSRDRQFEGLDTQGRIAAATVQAQARGTAYAHPWRDQSRNVGAHGQRRDLKLTKPTICQRIQGHIRLRGTASVARAPRVGYLRQVRSDSTRALQSP